MATGSNNCSPEEHVLVPMEEVGDALANTGDRDSLPGSDSVDDGAVVDPEQKRESGRTVLKIKIFNSFIDETLAGLPSTAAVLWLTLFRFERQGIARASLNTLAKRMGVDRKTVDRNMRLLYKHQKGASGRHWQGQQCIPARTSATGAESQAPASKQDNQAFSAIQTEMTGLILRPTGFALRSGSGRIELATYSRTPPCGHQCPQARLVPWDICVPGCRH